MPRCCSRPGSLIRRRSAGRVPRARARRGIAREPACGQRRDAVRRGRAAARAAIADAAGARPRARRRADPRRQLGLAPSRSARGWGRGVPAPASARPPMPATRGRRARSGDWILFLDADCRAPGGLLDAYFGEPTCRDVGALAGEVVPCSDGEHARGTLRRGAELPLPGGAPEPPVPPRAVAANLLVRRAAFEPVGGFYEGVRAAEDTDFSWRLQQAGWKLELRRGAHVEHRYRDDARRSARQWRGYAAGPRLARSPLRRVRARAGGGAGRCAARARSGRRGPRVRVVGSGRAARRRSAPGGLSVAVTSCSTRCSRPTSWPGWRSRTAPRPRRKAAEVVFVADRFPVRGDPLVEFARALERRPGRGRRPRPESPDVEWPAALQSTTARTTASPPGRRRWSRCVVRHPLRSAGDALSRRPGEPVGCARSPRQFAGCPRSAAPGPRARRRRHARRRAAARRLAGRPLETRPADARPRRRPVGVHAALRPRAVPRRSRAPGARSS